LATLFYYPGEHPDRAAEQSNADCYKKRSPCAMNHAAEYISAKVVGPEKESPGRRLKGFARNLEQRSRSNLICEDCGGNKEGEQDEPRDCGFVVFEAASAAMPALGVFVDSFIGDSLHQSLVAYPRIKQGVRREATKT
jgi:hypothetical protein